MSKRVPAAFRVFPFFYSLGNKPKIRIQPQYRCVFAQYRDLHFGQVISAKCLFQHRGNHRFSRPFSPVIRVDHDIADESDFARLMFSPRPKYKTTRDTQPQENLQTLFICALSANAICIHNSKVRHSFHYLNLLWNNSITIPTRVIHAIFPQLPGHFPSLCTGHSGDNNIDFITLDITPGQ